MNRTLITKSVLVMAIMGSSLSAGASTLDKPGIGASTFAAEPATYLTKEQVIPLMKKLPVYVEGYTEKEVSLHENIAFYPNGAVWSSYWTNENGGNDSLHIDVDATTGKLVQFVIVSDHPKREATADSISKEEALKKAEAFLKTVAPDVNGRISRANEYPIGDVSPQIMGHAFVFARVENDILFPENYLQVLVDSNGEIYSYTRIWYEGKLPSPVPEVTIEEAAKRWEESVMPTLHYVYIHKKMSLVYSYDEKSPIFIDAMTNQPITILGESSSQQPPIVPLGASTRIAEGEPIKLDDFDKREKADEIALTMFRAVPDQHSQTVSSVSILTWDDSGEGSVSNEETYQYARPDIGTEKELKFRLGIDDYGEIMSFSVEEELGAIENRSYPNPIPYKKAMATATDFMKKLYPDRQGELYAIHFPPTEESKRALFEQHGGYDITFGWLKQGIPVNGLEAGVTVDPVSGEVKRVFTFPSHQSLQSIEAQAPSINVTEAKQVEKGKKELRLTYFMPHPEWRTGTYLVSREPRLVYRMIGDEGVVDAASGKWVSHTK